MLGIRGFKPVFYSQSQQVPAALLAPLIGQVLVGSWLAWHKEDDEWFEDAPVLLQLGEVQLELCHFKLDQLSITIQTIDRSAGLDWCGAGDEIPLVWRRNALPALAAVVGKTVECIRLVDYRFGLAGHVGTSSLILTSLELGFTGGGVLAISNGLDCNTITDTSASGDDFQVRKLTRESLV